jgi:hypothetical protein
LAKPYDEAPWWPPAGGGHLVPLPGGAAGPEGLEQLDTHGPLILAAATQRADPGPLGVDDSCSIPEAMARMAFWGPGRGTRPVAGQPPEQVPQVKQRSTISGTILSILRWLRLPDLDEGRVIVKFFKPFLESPFQSGKRFQYGPGLPRRLPVRQVLVQPVKALFPLHGNQ